MDALFGFRRYSSIVFGCALAVGLVSAADPQDEQRDVLEAVRQAVRLGHVVPLEGIVADALRRIPGKVVEIEIDLDDDAYEIEVLDSAGKVWELEYRASTGALLEIERD